MFIRGLLFCMCFAVGQQMPSAGTRTLIQIERKTTMYAITGITGKVGGALARALLADRRPVRAVIQAR